MFRKHQLIFIITIIAFLGFALVGCGQQAPQQGEKQETPQPEAPKVEKAEITIATGGAGGPYHVIATGLSEIWNANVPEVNVTVASTAASVVNARMVEEGKADLAFIMSDIAYYANKGEAMFDKPLTNVLGFSSVHTNYVQLITTKDSGIKSVNDLKGKRVGVGAPGSGTELNARHVLGAYGMTYDDLKKADYLSYAETAEQLANRNIDAGFVTGGLPVAAISELSTKQDIAIIPIEKEKIDELAKSFPFYISNDIPGGTYKGVDNAVLTLAMKNYLIVKKDLDPELVNKLVTVMYENLDKLKDYHAAAKEYSLENATEAMALPLHPGVEKYYKEKGIK